MENNNDDGPLPEYNGPALRYDMRPGGGPINSRKNSAKWLVNMHFQSISHIGEPRVRRSQNRGMMRLFEEKVAMFREKLESIITCELAHTQKVIELYNHSPQIHPIYLASDFMQEADEAFVADCVKTAEMMEEFSWMVGDVLHIPFGLSDETLDLALAVADELKNGRGRRRAMTRLWET